MNIIFDFGNVLVEWNPVQLILDHYPPLPQAWHPRHTPESAAAFASALISHPDWLDFDRGLLESAELAERSARRLALGDAADLYTFIERIPQVLPVFDDAVAAMLALADRVRDGQSEHRVLYLSNMPASYAKVLAVRCPWIARFEDGIFSGNVKLVKPDAAIYEAAEQRFQLDSAQTLFLDDSPRNVEAARLRGWKAEIIDSHQSVRHALAAHGIL